MSVMAGITSLLLAAAAAPAPFQVFVRQSVESQRPSAIAAYTLDSEIAEASAHDGRVTVIGRSPGVTQLAIVTDAGVDTMEIAVVSPPNAVIEALSRRASFRSTAWDGTYESETGWLGNSVDLLSQNGPQAIRFHVQELSRTASSLGGASRHVVPSLSLGFSSTGRDVVLFDESVRVSPLTIDGTSLRGLHYRQGRIEIQAGYASSLAYQALVPSDREWAVGASYRWVVGASSLRPIVFLFPHVSDYGGASGGMGSVVFEHGREPGRFHVSGEIGFGHKLGAALSTRIGREKSSFRLDARYQPDGFASIGLGRPHGTFGEGAYSRVLGTRLSIDLGGSVAHYETPLLRQRNDASTLDVRYRLSTHWSAWTGARLAWFGGRAQQPPVRTLTLPIGAAYEAATGGFSALYRGQQDSVTQKSSSGGHLNVHVSRSGFKLSAFADRQTHVPSLDAVFRELPGLDTALAELGLVVTSPEDVARLLQENALPLGYIDRLSVNLSPRRDQGGGDLSWTSGGRTLALQLLLDRTQTVTQEQRTRLATISWSQKLSRGLEVILRHSRWTRQIEDGPQARGSSFSLAVRARMSGLPSLPSFRRSHLDGAVYKDEDARGRLHAGLPGYAGLEVLLDGTRRTTTDALGRFSFDGVGTESHVVEVIVPADGGLYFTGASQLTARAGDPVAFGVTRSPAHLLGFVLTDTGSPMAGISVRLIGNGQDLRSSTSSLGRYVFSAPEGDYHVEIGSDSLPAGYAPAEEPAANVHLSAAQPSRLDRTVQTNRSVSGAVLGCGSRPAEVRVAEIGRAAVVSPSGEYVFRKLKAGHLTMTVECGGHIATRAIDVPEGPATLRGIDIRP
jgi:hypothetical protein